MVRQFVTVMGTGDYALCPTETADTGVKGLVIPLKNLITLMSTTASAGNTSVTFDRVMVEYRRALGFDRYLDRLGTSWLDTFKTDGPVREDPTRCCISERHTSLRRSPVRRGPATGVIR